jgi:hypothetical protein
MVVLLLISIPHLIVTNESIVFIYRGIHTTRRAFQFNEIKKIELDLPLTQRKDFIIELLPTSLSVISLWNTLVISYKDGKTKEVKTSIFRNQIEQAILTIKQQNVPIEIEYIKKGKG